MYEHDYYEHCQSWCDEGFVIHYVKWIFGVDEPVILCEYLYIMTETEQCAITGEKLN